MTPPGPPARPRGLKLHDLAGLVVGYGLAALLARTFWPRAEPIAGAPGLALAFEFSWLGLAMSGPIILLLERRAAAPPGPRPKRPARPGRLISHRLEADPSPVGRFAAPADPETPAARPYTRAELAWIVTGGYWIGLTMFVVPALSIDTPWALVGLLQVIAAVGLMVVVPGRKGAAALAPSWTHHAAVALMATWPVAWALLILLSRSF